MVLLFSWVTAQRVDVGRSSVGIGRRDQERLRDVPDVHPTFIYKRVHLTLHTKDTPEGSSPNESGRIPFSGSRKISTRVLALPDTQPDWLLNHARLEAPRCIKKGKKTNTPNHLGSIYRSALLVPALTRFLLSPKRGAGRKQSRDTSTDGFCSKRPKQRAA